MIRVQLPGHLRRLAGVDDDVLVTVAGAPTVLNVLDAVEARYPVLRGTIRDHATKARRAYLRYYACERDISHEPADTVLPAAVVDGREPLLVIGAISGG